MIDRDVLIREMMENYPEASSGNCMKCVKYNYKDMCFTFVDDETDKTYTVTLDDLRRGLDIFINIVEDGKYYDSVGHIPNPRAVGWDYDSQDCDALVQCSILGKIVYG